MQRRREETELSREARKRNSNSSWDGKIPNYMKVLEMYEQLKGKFSNKISSHMSLKGVSISFSSFSNIILD